MAAEAAGGGPDAIAAGAALPHLAGVRWIRSGEDSIRVLLRPRHLGEIDLSIQVRKGRVTAIVHASSEGARMLLVQRPAELQAALEHQGLRLDGFEFQSRTPGGDGGPGDQAGRQPDPRTPDPDPAPPIPTRPPKTLPRRGAFAGRGHLDLLA
jgi:hypothetical protein